MSGVGNHSTAGRYQGNPGTIRWVFQRERKINLCNSAASIKRVSSNFLTLAT
jgi:hypothetical protein